MARNLLETGSFLNGTTLRALSYPTNWLIVIKEEGHC